MMNLPSLIAKTNSYLNNNQTDVIINVANLAEEILYEIEKKIVPGISEAQALDAALAIFKGFGIEKLWHRPLIRFNQNTLCTFKERANINYILQEEDIAFIDIGIVKEGIEGDVGKTLVFGENTDFLHLKNACEIIFQHAISFWKAENPTGIQLYEFIYAEAKKYDVLFNLSPAGHLIGAFPHTHAWTKGANTYPEKLLPVGWILEIQIKSPTQPFGAFQEGLLI